MQKHGAVTLMSTLLHKHNDKGFTLIEIMITMVILSIGLLAVAQMQINAVQGNSVSMGMSEASNLAHNHIETLAALDYNNANFLNDVDGDGANGGGLGSPGPDNIWGTADDTDIGAAADYSTVLYSSLVDTLYSIDWNVSINFPIANTKTIRTIVSWTDYNKFHSLTIDYIKYN